MGADIMTREEIEEFARRLEAFEEGLSPRERAVLRMVLERAAENGADDVEAHRLARTSIAALVLAIAGTVGVADANAGPAHHTAPAVTHVHHVVSTVGDEKGGSQTIAYDRGGPAMPQ